MKQLLGNLMLSASMMLAVLPGVVSAQTPTEGDDKSRRSRRSGIAAWSLLPR